MLGEELTLEDLRSQFLDQFKDEYLFDIFKMIYEHYQKELLLKFEPFYEELLKCFEAERQQEIERNLFELDFMMSICQLLDPIFFINKLTFEQAVRDNDRLPAVALIYFNNKEEKVQKESFVGENAKSRGINFYNIYLDLNIVRAEIDSLMLMPTTIIGMTQTKTGNLSEYYKKKMGLLKKSVQELRSDAQHGRKFKGKELSPENEKIYKEILSIQKELFNEHGPGHSSSLTQSVRVYNQRNKLFWNESKIKSVGETIRKLRENKSI